MSNEHLFDDLREATPAEFSSAFNMDPELRRIIAEVGTLEHCKDNELLTEEGERVLEAVREKAPGFSPAADKLDPDDDMSLCRNNPLLSENLDGSPGEPPEPAWIPRIRRALRETRFFPGRSIRAIGSLSSKSRPSCVSLACRKR